MSKCLFLSPHFDDETLFGSFTICGAESIDIFICYVPEDKTEFTSRLIETQHAISILCSNKSGKEFWSVLNAINPHFEKKGRMGNIIEDLDKLNKLYWYDQVFAPMNELGGNEDHNQLSLAADEVFGNKVTHYATYTWSAGRTETSNPVYYEPEWIALKHRALACYVSQMKRKETVEHFINCIREFYE